MSSNPKLKITLISPDSLTPYSGMIPGYLSGEYTEEECHIDLRHLCNFSGSRFIKDAVYNIDTKNRYVFCNSNNFLYSIKINISV